MKSTALGWLLFTFALSMVSASALEDGFYHYSDDPPAAATAPVTALDGNKIYLGEKVPDALKGGKITSESNDNSAYMFEIWRNAPALGDKEKLVIVLNEQCCRFWGEGGDATHCNLEGSVSDQNFVDHLAAFLKVVPLKRQHPGHQFTARFVTDPKGYKMNEPIDVTLEITNCGAQPFSIEQPSLPDRSLDAFAFTAQSGNSWDTKDNSVKNKPDFKSEQAEDIKMSAKTLKPGETLSLPVNLRDYLEINHLGHYDVRGSYCFKIIRTDSSARTIWTDSGYHILWDDYATAEFTFQVR